MATAQAFWLPKRGHAVEEYEDASSVGPDRFAIADGATESSFAGEWARLLTGDFVEHATAEPIGWLKRLPVLGETWWSGVVEPPLPWYAEAKREEGAFATFLGLILGEEGNWRAFAVGDCCLFQLRAGVMLTCFPVTAPEEFGNTPWLLGSRREVTEEWQRQAVKETGGDWLPGDEFWLLSDAVACWLLTTHWADTERPVVMPFAASAAGFAAWVNAERDAGTMRNDDCTWLVVSTE